MKVYNAHLGANRVIEVWVCKGEALIDLGRHQNFFIPVEGLMKKIHELKHRHLEQFVGSFGASRIVRDYPAKLKYVGKF
jgi:hypothetical protein